MIHSLFSHNHFNHFFKQITCNICRKSFHQNNYHHSNFKCDIHPIELHLNYFLFPQFLEPCFTLSFFYFWYYWIVLKPENSCFMIVENKRNTTAIVKITECLGLLNYRSKLKPSFCNFLRPSSKHYQHVLRCFHAEPKLFCSLVTGDLYENLRKPNYKLYMLILLDEWKIVTRILIFIPSRQMIPMDDTIYIECSQEKFKRSKE